LQEDKEKAFKIEVATSEEVTEMVAIVMIETIEEDTETEEVTEERIELKEEILEIVQRDASTVQNKVILQENAKNVNNL
jgi:hypothetical protein